MKTLIVVTLMAVTLSAAADAQPQSVPAAAPTPEAFLGPVLWDGARFGMSVADVQALFPAAAAITGDVRADGSQAGLGLATNVAGAPATAKFYFKPDGLQAVIVDRPDVAAGQTAANLAKAHVVADQLSALYGAPRSCVTHPRVTEYSCDWTPDVRKVIVSYRDVGGGAPALSIVYRRFNDQPRWSPHVARRTRH